MPNNANEGKSISDILNDANNKSKGLYSLFNKVSELQSLKKNEKEFCNNVSKKCNIVIKEIVNKGSDITKQKDILENLQNNKKVRNFRPNLKTDNEDAEKRNLELIKRMVEENLRKAFRCKISVNDKNTKIDISAVVLKLVTAIYHMEDYENEYKKISDNEIAGFLQILNKDYFKEEQIITTANSIERQTVKSQKLNIKDDKLCLSNARHEKKKYLFEFMQQMVSGSLEGTEAKEEFEKALALFYCLDDGQPFKNICESKEEFCNSENVKIIIDLENEEQKVRDDNNLSRNERKNQLKELDAKKKKILDCEAESHYESSLEKIKGDTDLNKHLKFIKDKTKEILIKKNSNNAEKRQIGCLCNYVCEQRKFWSCMKYIKKLIVLYFYGENGYNDFIETDIAKWGFKDNAYNKDIEFNENIAAYVDEKFNKKDKKYRREKNAEIKAELRMELKNRFNAAVEVLNIDKGKHKNSMDKYWLRFINDKTEELLLGKYCVDKQRKRKLDYLCEYVWDEWVAFICGKFIDFGKGIYHFAMPDVRLLEYGKQVSFGKILDKYKDGIASFDYERIQAEEDLDRDVAVYISFAVNNFARAVCTDEVREKNQDVLTMKLNRDTVAQDAKKKALQYFGGQSQWQTPKESPCSEGDKEWVAPCNKGDIELVKALKEEIYNVRNRSFHYTGITHATESEGRELILEMFNREYSCLSEVYIKKYYSNSVTMFYSVGKIVKLMNKLYGGASPRKAHIPSFQRIVKMNDFMELAENIIGINVSSLSDLSDEYRKKYKSALYFLLKEIYYYGFQQDDKIEDKFYDALKDECNSNSNNENKFPTIDFRKRICQLNGVSKLNEISKINGKKLTLGEICHQIMIDYELQNNKEMHARSGVKGKYEQYPILLCNCIRKAFVSYLEDNFYEFLKNPADLTKGSNEDDFYKAFVDWEAKTFNFSDIEKSNPMILSWYITAHFMNPKHLNHLIGSIRSYICYVEGIEKRSGSTGMRVMENSQIENFKQLTEILEFTLLYVEKVTNEPGDYFNDNEGAEYSEHLEKYVDFKNCSGEGALEKLKNFCAMEVTNGHNGRVGIYFDEDRIIVNRNIVKAIMYGNEKLLSKCAKPVTYEEIEEYYKMKSDLRKVFKEGVENGQEQEKLKKFQHKKNRIELENLSRYSEIVNELLSKLISWAYLRERDLMYFQLGWQYTKLFYTNAIKENDKRRKICNGADINIEDGAILNQIISMYTYGVPMYKKNNGVWKGVDKKSATGAKVSTFIETYGNEVYTEGIGLFEVESAHDEIVKLRNYIDHFKYQAGLDKSILELYAIYYDQMLSYSPKLRKSVAVVLQNILKNYFISADVKFDEGCRNAHKSTAMKVINMKSDKFTYKKFSLKTDAREQVFMDELKAILEYTSTTRNE